ncbi:hypothetical protein BpHYR1_007329 [Brachionus plicatilis]|uniref:Uncharacterized protein n=1 Tax=Brachionus plicatilis TaxID=10195 RepID=A0A3M7RZJ0_BRAPC|nr:hypothetical protein BpHYR1_007329 [Brachionus plicatilis]
MFKSDFKSSRRIKSHEKLNFKLNRHVTVHHNFVEAPPGGCETLLDQVWTRAPFGLWPPLVSALPLPQAASEPVHHTTHQLLDYNQFSFCTEPDSPAR